MKTNKIKILLLFLVFGMVGCNQSTVFEKYYPIKGNCWHKDSIAPFAFAIGDTVSAYNMLIDIRNQGNYPYSNLWLFIDVVAPDKTLLRDTFEVQLAEPNGKWIGNGTSGLYDLQKFYKHNIFFPQSGVYSVAIQQGMYSENDCLKGIHDVGIKIEKRK